MTDFVVFLVFVAAVLARACGDDAFRQAWIRASTLNLGLPMPRVLPQRGAAYDSRLHDRAVSASVLGQ